MNPFSEKPTQIADQLLSNHTKRREEIIEATLQVIEDVGLENVTVRAIARVVRCTTGVLMHYFKNKDEIIQSTLEYIFEQFDRRFGQAITEQDGFSAIHAIATRSLPTTNSDKRLTFAWQCFALKAAYDSSLANIIRKRHARIHQDFARLIRQGQQDGSIRADIRAEHLADIINGFLEGFALRAPIESQRLNDKHLIELVELQLKLILSPNNH